MADTADLADFAELLQAARQHAEAQRLLFVFANRELDDKATAAQRDAFAQGAGGYLEPCMCVDKVPVDVADFASLVAESEHTGQPWDIVFVAAITVPAGLAPGTDPAEESLHSMIGAIKQGRVAQFAAFDRAGNPLKFGPR